MHSYLDDPLRQNERRAHARAFNTPDEIEAFERNWRGLPSGHRMSPDPVWCGRIQAMVLADQEKAIAQGARFDDYVTVFTLPDEAVQPPKPPGRRRKPPAPGLSPA